MSSTNKTANYQLSQFVGNDIPSILNDYNGDMRKIDSAIHDATVAGGDNASAIAELQSSTARLNTEISGINSTVNTLSGKVVGVEAVIPATASADNKLLTAQELPEIPSITELEQNVADLQEEVSDMGGDVKAIQLCVPANASENNKLATIADIGGAGNSITLLGSQYSNYNQMMAEFASRISALNLTEKQKRESFFVIGGVNILHCIRGDSRLMEFNDVRYEPLNEYIAIYSNFFSLNLNSPSYSYYNSGGIKLSESGNTGFSYTAGATETPENVTFYY